MHMVFSRYEATDDGHIFDKQQQCLIKEFRSNKYLQCVVYDDDGIPHVLGVHQVVARFRCDDWFEGCIVHHKDENGHNNAPYNLECYSRRRHSRKHIYDSGNQFRLRDYVKKHGPHNKGKKMSEEFKKHCSESAKKRGFNGNQYVDKSGNQRTS